MNIMKHKIFSLLLILSLFVSMVGIINVDYSYAASKKIHLKKTTISIEAEKTYQQKLIDKKGKTIKATKVKWKSSKPSVAKINKKGKITAVKAGTAKMTAKYKGKTYKFTVKVKNNSETTKIITKYVGYANQYAEYLRTDVGDMYCYNFLIWDSERRDAAASSCKTHLKEAKAWLQEARKITSSKGYTAWDRKIVAIIDQCTELLIKEPDFSTKNTLFDYTERVLDDVSNPIKALYEEMGGGK